MLLTRRGGDACSSLFALSAKLMINQTAQLPIFFFLIVRLWLRYRNRGDSTLCGQWPFCQLRPTYPLPPISRWAKWLVVAPP
jgi:hypothetical protein